jgi:hypothetical protein
MSYPPLPFPNSKVQTLDRIEDTKSEGNLRYYGEWAPYFTEEEKKESKEYLSLWKKIYLRKIRNEFYEVKIINESEIDRPPTIGEEHSLSGTIGLKMCIEIQSKTENE